VTTSDTPDTVYVLLLMRPNEGRAAVSLYLDRDDAEAGARKLLERGSDAAHVTVVQGRVSDPELRTPIGLLSMRIPEFAKAREQRRFERLSTKLRERAAVSIAWRPRWSVRIVSLIWLLPLVAFPLWPDPIARVIGSLGVLVVGYLAAIAWLNTHTIRLEGEALVFRSGPVPFPGATRTVDKPEFATSCRGDVVVQSWFGAEQRLVHVGDPTLAAAISYEINRRWFRRSVMTLLWTQRVEASMRKAAN